MEKKSPTNENTSYLRKEVFSDTSEGNPKQHSEALRQFSSSISGLEKLNTKLQKINALKKTQPGIDMLSILNSVLPEEIATHNSDNPKVHAYFTKQWDDIVLVVNNIVSGKEVMNSESAMKTLLEKIDSMMDEQKISDIIWLWKNPDKTICKYGISMRTYGQTLQQIQSTYKSNTDVVSSVFDMGNSISNTYKQSFENTKKNIQVSYEAFLKEYTSLKGTHNLSPDQEMKLERVKKSFERILTSKFETISIGEAVKDGDVVGLGKSLAEDFMNGTLWEYALAGIKWEWKGLYGSTIGFIEFAFKFSTDEKVREPIWKGLSKLWKYTKTNCTEPTKVWGDILLKLSREFEKIGNLPPEKQALMIGDIFGNIMGTILLGKGVSAGKNWLFTSAKFPKGISLIAKAAEFRSIKTWEHLEKYMADIEGVTWAKWIPGGHLPNLIQGIKEGTIKLSELPKDLWIRDKAAELLKYGGEIPESVGVLNNTATKAGDLAIAWAQKTGDLAKKAIDSKAVNSIKKTAEKFADTVNDSKLGKGVEKASSAVTKETMKQLVTLGEIIGNIEHKLQLLKKLETTLSFPGGVYNKTKGGLEAMGENYARNMTLKTLNHLEETLETLGDNIKELWASVQKDPRIIATLSRTTDSLINNVKYLLERLVKDPLLANITEYWAFIAPIQGELWFLLEITQGLIGDVKNGVLKGTKWTNNVNIGVGKVSENHWINKKIDGALSPKESLSYSGGMAKVTRKVEINGEIKELIGFKDHNGKMAIDPTYEMAQDFKNGYAVVTENGKVNIIDKKWIVSKLDLEAEKVKNIRITDDGRATIELKVWNIDSAGVFDMKTGKYMIEPNENIEMGRNFSTNKNKGLVIFIKEKFWWNLISSNGKLIEGNFKGKPEKILYGFIIEDASGWRVITSEWKLLKRSFKSKPEELWSHGLIAEDASGWRIATSEWKLVEGSFKNKPEKVELGFVAEDASGWRIITREWRLVEGSFKNKPEEMFGFVAEDASGWKIITHNGDLMNGSFKNKPEKTWLGFIIEDTIWWQLITCDGKFVKGSFKNKPEGIWTGFIAEDASGWRLITGKGEFVKGGFKNKPERLRLGFVAEDASGWRIINHDGKSMKGNFKNKPEELWTNFCITDTNGWRVFTHDGKLVEGNFKNKPEKLWLNFIAEDASGWRIIGRNKELAGKIFKSKPEGMWSGFVAEDASGWRILTNKKLIREVFKNKPEKLWDHSFVIEDSHGWSMVTYDWKLVKNSFSHRPKELWKLWFKIQTEMGIKFINKEWDVLSGVFNDIRLSPDGKVQFEKFNGEIFEIDQNLLWKVENSSVLANNDLILTAAFVEENADYFKKWGKNIQKDINLQTTRYIGEDAPKIISVLEKETKLEDFFVGLRADNREMSTSFRSLKNTFSDIKDTKKLEKKVGKTVDEGIQIYIQNINDRRAILNGDRMKQGLPKLEDLSPLEVSYLKGKYKARMEREFMQAIRQEIAIQEGGLSSMSPSLWNQENLRNIMGKFVNKENMKRKLYTELSEISWLKKNSRIQENKTM